MKFISVCDATGVIECELFADVYRRFAIETVRNPVVEIVGQVMPFANGNGHTLRVRRVAKARSLTPAGQDAGMARNRVTKIGATCET